MPLFRTAVYLAPLLVGFGLPAVLALTRSRPASQRAVSAAGFVAGFLALLLLLSLGDSPLLWPPVALIVSSLALLVAGVHLAAERCGAPPAAAQLAAGLVAAALVGSVFVLGPLVDASADAGADGAVLYARISRLLAVNPLFVTGAAVFKADLLVLPTFYRMNLAGYQHATPTLLPSCLIWAVPGAALLGLSAVRLRR